VVFVIPVGAAAGEGERRGEIGIQVGVRWADDDIVPEDRSRAGGVIGIAGAYAFNTKWALIGDLTTSTHDSILFCGRRPPPVQRRGDRGLELGHRRPAALAWASLTGENLGVVNSQR
jgi:hypothetical protein